MKAIMIGILSAFFFAFTFVLNAAMEMNGGSWYWSASLRYFFMIPLLLIIVLYRKSLRALMIEMKKAPGKWILWSTIGFGLFYAPICFAAAYGPGWLIAATWQITIISGSLLAPLFYEMRQTSKGVIRIKGQIPFRGLLMSLIILVGVFVIQWDHASVVSVKDTFICTLAILIASFAYPLGNRKMMALTNKRLDPYQRVLGMTIASLPFWLLLAFIGLQTAGMPSMSQVYQSGLVALFSGVFATVLFFAATDLVQGNMQKLGAVEATQSFEVLFAMIGEVIILSAPLPSVTATVGISLVILGMALHSYVSNLPQKGFKKKKVEETV